MSQMSEGVIDMTPEEAMELSIKLLECAQKVMRHRKKQPGAYDYTSLVGSNMAGNETRVMKFRIGAE